MLKNYLVVTVRNMVRKKVYTLINIVGLAVGIACCLLITLWVMDELSYDGFHENADRMFRVQMNIDRPDGSHVKFSSGPMRLRPSWESDFAQLESIVRVSSISTVVKYDQVEYNEDQMAFADAEFFNFFSFPLLRGNPDTVLVDMATAVIDTEIAAKYFGTEDPIGKTLYMDGDKPVRITGLMEKMPENSHFHFNILVSMKTGELVFPRIVYENWGEFSVYTYVRLPDGMTADGFESGLTEWIDRTYPSSTEKMSDRMQIHLMPITDIHLHSSARDEIEANGDIQHVLIFSLVALLTLLIACINYMNLATARSAGRSIEVGIRKVVGGQRAQLIFQFLSESVLITMGALLLAVCIAELFLPVFNSLSGKDITIFRSGNLLVLAGFMVLMVIVGLFAGSYPALFLSSAKPVHVIKGVNETGTRTSTLLRKVLVVFQFAISISLIAGTLVIHGQLRYMQQKKLGIQPENVVFFPYPKGSHDTLKQELLQDSNILNVTVTNKKPTGRLSSNLGFKAEGFQTEGSTSIKILTVDHDFFKTLDIPVVKGRDFSREFGTDATNAFILNEAAVQLIGWEEPVGKWFETSTLDENNAWQSRRGTVVGVAQNFHFESLHETIKPVVYFIEPNWWNWVEVRITGTDVSGTMDRIASIWKRYQKDRPFQFFFLEESIQRLYDKENRFLRIFSYFSGLALLIACLGIFGLSAYTAEQRTKEIGIRKTMGASVAGIVSLMLKDVSVLVLASNLIGLPLAWFAMNRWLSAFPYRIELGISVFLLAGVGALGLAMMVISFHAVKAARSRPVEALKYE